MAAVKFSAKLGEATDAGEKFVQVFYETFDRRRKVYTNSKVTLVCFVVIKAHLLLYIKGNSRTIFRCVIPRVERTHQVRGGGD